MNPFLLHLVSAGICQVRTNAGLHVGNFKQIGGVWKFKAIGYGVSGVVPGGGPLTARHNTILAILDEAEVMRVFADPQT